MSAATDRIQRSPVDFQTAVAYALHPEMRRLIILYLVGVILLPVGLNAFVTAGGFQPLIVALIERSLGLALTIIGATFLFAGLIGTAFKVITDANRLAHPT